MNQTAKRFCLSKAIIYGGAIAATAALSLLLPSPSAKAELEQSPKAILDEAWQIVNREYVDSSFNHTDWQVTRQELLSQEYSSAEQAYTALRQALEELNDPYTRFLDPKQFQTLTSQTSGEMTGVGMQLGQDRETQIIAVVDTLEDSPAFMAGLKAGDRIIAINGKPTQTMTVADAAELIRGEIGTQVSLRVARLGINEFDVTLTRALIQLKAVHHRMREEGNKRVGYIRLQEFSSHAGEQMEKAIKELQKQDADAFVLDLRGNPGGLLRISIDIARMWMDTGAIVSTVDRHGYSEEARATRSALTDKPLVVLVNDDSASASEILAGALKDNRRAVVMGDKTFGKALVQSVHSLSDGSGLAVTIAHYYTPNGTDISKKGVTPDVMVSLSEDQKRQMAIEPESIGTMSDPLYERAVGLLQNEALMRSLVLEPGTQAGN
jgi:carboxyl-terminal processing protease